MTDTRVKSVVSLKVFLGEFYQGSLMSDDSKKNAKNIFWEYCSKYPEITEIYRKPWSIAWDEYKKIKQKKRENPNA